MKRIFLLVFTACLIFISYCVTLKQKQAYEFVCFFPDENGQETETISGKINDLQLGSNYSSFIGPDGKRIIMSNIKCLFKESNGVLDKK
jgi:hypothetical protein